MQINHVILNIRLACSARYEQLVVHANICVCVGVCVVGGWTRQIDTKSPESLQLAEFFNSSTASTTKSSIVISVPQKRNTITTNYFRVAAFTSVAMKCLEMVILRSIKAALTLYSLNQTPKQIRG